MKTVFKMIRQAKGLLNQRIKLLSIGKIFLRAIITRDLESKKSKQLQLLLPLPRHKKRNQDLKVVQKNQHATMKALKKVRDGWLKSNFLNLQIRSCNRSIQTITK